MKSLVNRVVVAILIGTLASIFAFANDKKDTVTFPTNVKVNGTLVKKGTYEVAFNEQSGELSIMKGNKIVAKTTAKLEKRDEKARDTLIRMITTDGVDQLVSITFGGSDQNIVVNQSSAQTGN